MPGRICPESFTAVYNAANEIAVDQFIAGKIPFTGIWANVEKTMNAHQVQFADQLEPIIEADQWARNFARSLVS